MEQLSQNISSTCRGDNVDIKYTVLLLLLINTYTKLPVHKAHILQQYPDSLKQDY